MAGDEYNRPLLNSRYSGSSLLASNSSIDCQTLPPNYGGTLKSNPFIPVLGSEETLTSELNRGDGSFLGKVDTQQSIELPDDLHLQIRGLRDSPLGLLIYYVLGFGSAGIIFLLGKWLPSLQRLLIYRQTSLDQASKVVVQNQFGEEELIDIDTVSFNGSFSHIFENEKKNHNGFKKDIFLKEVKRFQYRFITFLLNPATGSFQTLHSWKDNRWEEPALLHKGLDSQTLIERMTLFEKNELEIPQKPLVSLLVEEVLHPFYIFQVFSIILWCFEQYHIYAASIFLISSFSVVSALIQTRENWQQLREMSRFVCPVQVCRNGIWSTICSTELVPGDLYDISSQEFSIFPCDSVLLQGDCIVNEGMLTGESLPVSKLPLTDVNLFQQFSPSSSQIPPELSRSLLFSGTQLIRVRSGVITHHSEKRAVAMVFRTGFNTTKGALVRSILFPRPNLFQFYRDSFYFIGVMSLFAFAGFILTVFKLLDLGMSHFFIVVRALDIVTIVVPPALPATMSVGMSFSLARLRQQGVFCIAPGRINVGGKINAMCFDKTGTLTEEGLALLGVQASDGKSLLSLECSVTNLPSQNQLNFLHCLATCHSIKVVKGELLGDPLDLRMFEATGWTLEEGGCTFSATPSEQKRQSAQLIPCMVRPPNQRTFSLESLNSSLIDSELQPSVDPDFIELAMLRSFEFTSALRRMSVVVKRWRSSSTEIYVKGAPEVISELCIASTIPHDYHQQLKAYTQSGYRVIACAGKSESKFSWVQVQHATRSKIESGLTFLGFLVFENKLKAGTIPALSTLREANIRQIMCTGDNYLTATSVARECGIIDPGSIVFVPKVEPISHRILWEAVDWPRESDETFTNIKLFLDDSLSFLGRYDIVIPGDMFREIVDLASPDVVQRMLCKAQVYARMSPEQKQELVEMLQSLGYCVGFCGDGANDCGALKQADVGISLSESEASVAAPFTSNSDITCVPLLIREGRAALVTSFSCFKYMGLYSITQFATIILLYNYGGNLGDYQFLLFDLFLILPIAVAMGRTLPYDKLHSKPPTASLVSKRVLISFVGQCFLYASLQACVYLYLLNKPWFVPPTFDPEDPNISSMVNTTLFYFSSYQYLWGSVVFSVGFPYRKSMFSNIPYMVTLCSILLFLLVIHLNPPSIAIWLFELVPLPIEFRYTLLVSVFLNLLISYLYEQYFAPLLSDMICSLQDKVPMFSSKPCVAPGSLAKPSKKLYKRILNGLSDDIRSLQNA